MIPLLILFLPVCSHSVFDYVLTCVLHSYGIMVEVVDNVESQKGDVGRLCIRYLCLGAERAGNTTLTCREVSQQGGPDRTIIETSR